MEDGGIVFLVCEVCGCSNLDYKEVCDCTLNLCGCYAFRTGDEDAYWDEFFKHNDPVDTPPGV